MLASLHLQKQGWAKPNFLGFAMEGVPQIGVQFMLDRQSQNLQWIRYQMSEASVLWVA